MATDEPGNVEIRNIERDRTHTVIPYELACSCTVQAGIGMFCDHLIALADADGFPGALTREYIKERTNTFTEESDTTKEEYDRISGLLHALDLDDYSLARTQVEMVNAFSGDSTADGSEKVPKPDEDRAAYRAMVKRVRIEEKDKWLPGCS
jgi:Glu-tRNA(Gln) amidotransferase subunit E-like FAD-binding protein